MSNLVYSLVVATLNRPDLLAGTLRSVAEQTLLPSQVIVVDASDNDASHNIVDNQKNKFDLKYVKAKKRSAALQRNQGAELVTSPLIGFIDDDIILRPDTMEKLVTVFDHDLKQEIGGVAARIEGVEHHRPRGLLWWYYRFQAGYSHPDYGARLFGPAINCLPCYEAAEGELIDAQWLNAGCTLYRTACFKAEQFPDFDGYSHMEDVHLSARIGKGHSLYFHRDAIYRHLDAQSEFKRDEKQLTQMRIKNQCRVAREVMKIGNFELSWKLFWHRLFLTFLFLWSGKQGNHRQILGLWT